ncbi:hypothetical protein [Serratia proteamaculans]
MLFILILEGGFFYSHFLKRYEIDCESSFLFRAPQNQFELQGTMTLKMDYKGKGRIGIDGIVKSKNERVRLNRYAIFTYQRLNETSFRMDQLKIEKGARDKVKDAYILDDFYSLELESRRIFTLHQLGDGYLVGGLQAPAFMCLPR